jgi:hypothetical protein
MVMGKIKSLDGFDRRWRWLRVIKVMDQGNLYYWTIYKYSSCIGFINKLKYLNNSN